MKILQLIDTLHVGGAERVALNYANSLPGYGIESHLCITREKGALIEEVEEEVQVHFVGKRNSIDLFALNRLIKIIKLNRIEIVHAHGTSWFFAVLCKIVGMNFKLIWHDHYGNSEYLTFRKFRILKLFSKKIDGIISVNEQLAKWAKKELNCKKVIFQNNFIREKQVTVDNSVILKGDSGSKFICVANLRPQKDHGTLIEAFKLVNKQNKNVSLHLFGKDFKDAYSSILIQIFDSTPSVYWYGEKENIIPYLEKADIGLLSSKSEGLPLALLEYAHAGLGVVCTSVGECSNVVSNDGILVPPNNLIALAEGMKIYLEDCKRLQKDSDALKTRIDRIYSENIIIPKYLNFCHAL
jgi:glycosyltransferase involved in cell wall biosynthesis